uniref:Late embryogenesis abundant protein n=1 Tax=Steinernema glaseri TaxID=37863 RepID=A0A1I7XVV6_9BILA
MSLPRIIAHKSFISSTTRAATASRPYSVQSRLHEAVDKSKGAFGYAMKKAGDAYEGAKHAAEDAYHFAEEKMHKVGDKLHKEPGQAAKQQKQESPKEQSKQ